MPRFACVIDSLGAEESKCCITMKYLLRIVLFSLCVLFITSSSNVISQSVKDQSEISSTETSVYICTGPKSQCYHSNSSCRGLRSCSGTIKKVTVKEAEKMNRRPCKICY